MGITVRDTARARVGGPTTRPLALVESGQGLTQQLRLVDESTPTRRAGLSDHDEQADVPRRVQARRRRQTAVYMARWINTRGEKGPWMEIAMATVAA